MAGGVWAEGVGAGAAEALDGGAGGGYGPERAARGGEWLFGPGSAIDRAVAERGLGGRGAPLDAYLRSKGFPVE